MEYRLTLAVIMVLVIIGNVLSLLGPKLAGKAISAAAAGKGNVDFSLVYTYAWQMLLCYVSSSLLTFAVNIGMMRTGRFIAKKLRGDVFDKLMEMPVSYFDQNQAGDIISRVSYDIDVISTCISADIVQILTSVVTVAGAFAMMAYISPALTAITLITIPLAIGYTRHMNKIARPLFAKRSASYGRMNGFVEEKFSGHRTIQGYAQEDQVSDAFREINQGAANAFYNADSVGRRVGPSVNFINNLGLALVGTLGSVLYLGGKIDLGEISSFVLYSRKFSGPINEIANITNEIYSGLAAAERVFQLLDAREEAADVENARELTSVRGEVSLRDVDFGYTPDRTILHGVDLQADPGKLIAIVGPTGAGKTTIINLLMRFYDAQEGTVYVDGRDVRTYGKQELRRRFGMVFQNDSIFAESLADNISLGRGLSREDIQRAAEDAMAAPFIEEKPGTYDYVADIKGANLSGGQKQRVLISRALAARPEILILDDATSALDYATDARLRQSLRTRYAGTTSVIVAQRVSSLISADKILVLDEGRVLDCGSHDELLERCEAYRDIYHSQMGELA